MNRELLKVKFDKKVKLPKLVKDTSENVPDQDDFRIKLFRLGFFVFILVVFILGGKIAIEYTVSFCQGTEHQSFQEVQENFKAFQAEQHR